MTLSIALEALEKQIAKKPVLKQHENRIISERMVEYCPNCDEVIEGYDKFDNNCPWCGQKLDWSDYDG